MRRRNVIKAAAAVAALAALGPRAQAQAAWPAKDKTVKVIVPWPPGAANDALGRLIAERIRARFGCTTVVENRAGGAGLLGTRAVIQAEPDGYTLLASAFNTAVMPMVLKAADFNPEVDLEFVGRTAVAPIVCVMSPSLPTITDTRHPYYDFYSWYGIWAPKETPREIQASLNTLIQETMRDAEVVKRLTGSLLEPVAESMEDSLKFIRSEIVRGAE